MRASLPATVWSRRLLASAWLLAAASLLAVLAREFPKSLPSKPPWAPEGSRELGVLLVLLPMLLADLLFFMTVPVLLLRRLGIAVTPLSEASVRVEVSDPVARRIAGSGLAQLIPLGYRLEEGPCGSDGWTRTAALKLYPKLSDDPRQQSQQVEFRFNGREFEIVHRAGGWLAMPSGNETHYRQWLLNALVREESIDHPPLNLNGTSLIYFSICVFSFACGALTAAMPGDLRGSWGFAALTTAGFGLGIGVTFLFLLTLQTRWTTGRWIVVPSFLLLAAGAVLALQYG